MFNRPSIKNYQNIPDDKLLFLIQKDDEDAFLEIYQRYWSKLYNYAFNVIRKTQVCEDIIQEIFVDLWLKKKEVLISNLSAYLFKSVKFQIFKFLRHQEVEQRHLQTINKIKLVNETENLINLQDLEIILNESITNLPNKCREIFYLSRFEQKSHQEIADQLGISVQTVKNQISKALKLLKASIPSLAVFLILCFS
ncbi:RNA polymerase sigma-70 factor [Flexithrix dorotheae]|uniref:RNA polymerase sigma-70 factor n=1 Tax=Flexithrix dorotheae TaxID=70993 RepID=UPI00036529AB|nr:RNA polymerase sigma-70 factor [Flexithrix dorotheae]